MLCLSILDPDIASLNLESPVFDFLELHPSYNTQVNVNMITSENRIKVYFSNSLPYAPQRKALTGKQNAICV